MPKTNTFIQIGALTCALCVILGAFGAHGLEPHLTVKEASTYQTGLRYLIIHALGMIVINLVFEFQGRYNKWVNYMLVGGMVLFSLSLVIHAVHRLIEWNVNVFALVAPIGGLCYIAAWIIFAYSIQKK